jgi:hypothetical protein
MSGEARGLPLAVLFISLGGAAPARAADLDPAAADGPALEVVGACPAAADVRRLLGEVVETRAVKGLPVSIQDRGARYRVTVCGEGTTFEDPGRDCAARARQAAVLVARDLSPHPPVLGPPTWTIEKGFVFDVTSGTEGAVWAPGAEIRGAYGSGLLSLVGAAGARGPVTLSFEHGFKAELLRFPLDAGGRLTMHRWRLRPWVMLGPSLTLTGFLGENLVQTDRTWRFDPGALVMIGATLPVRGRIGVAAALAFRWQPRPYELQVVPAGTVGQTPTWWLGLSLNYTVDSRPSRP